jgi:hypothetical protein
MNHALREALERAVGLLETIDAPVDRGHDARVTAEAWLEVVRPQIVALRAVLARPSPEPVGPVCALCQWKGVVGHEAHIRIVHPDADLTVVEQMGHKFIVRTEPSASGLREALLWWREKRYSVADLQRAWAQGEAAARPSPEPSASGLRKALERHTPEVADGPFIAACSCGWHATEIARASDGGQEWAAHALASEDQS